jgi:hypothetical protein
MSGCDKFDGISVDIRAEDDSHQPGQFGITSGYVAPGNWTEGQLTFALKMAIRTHDLLS